MAVASPPLVSQRCDHRHNRLDHLNIMNVSIETLQRAIEATKDLNREACDARDEMRVKMLSIGRRLKVVPPMPEEGETQRQNWLRYADMIIAELDRNHR